MGFIKCQAISCDPDYNHIKGATILTKYILTCIWHEMYLIDLL